MFPKYYKNRTAFAPIGMAEFIISSLEGSDYSDFQSIIYFNKKDFPSSLFEVLEQKWLDYCSEENLSRVRYSSKKTETCSCFTTSSIPKLNNQKGQFILA